MKVENKQEPEHNAQACSRGLMPVKDALEVISGKWKLTILLSLRFEPKRFRHIAKDVGGITDKMLSKELKDLETHQLITRTVYDSFPPTVEYAITDYGKSLGKVIDELAIWGTNHRKRIMVR